MLSAISLAPAACVIDTLRPYAELLYFLAGVGLLVVAGFGLRQFNLLKEDIRTRNIRAAREKALEAASSYLREFIPLYDEFWLKLKEGELQTFEGQAGIDFDFDSLPLQIKNKGLKRFEMLTIHSSPFNALELIAAYFTTGVADESVGFRIVGRSFCATVASNYDIFSMWQGTKPTPYYQNVIQLYRTWSPRLSKEELVAARSELEKNISLIAEGPLDRIQPDL